MKGAAIGMAVSAAIRWAVTPSSDPPASNTGEVCDGGGANCRAMTTAEYDRHFKYALAQNDSFASGLGNGFGSVFIGTGRAFRQIGRSTGLLGMDELHQTMVSGEQLNRAAGAALDNPETTAVLLKESLKYKISTSNSYDTGTMVGRVATGFVLAPLGVLAGVGDFLTGVENHGATMDKTLDYMLFGRPSTSE